ncbi:MAG: iron-sulfur cluster assembly accessory protein [Saprospiraceae bacterium]
MLYISDRAKEQIEYLIAKDELKKDCFIRVSVESGGCSGLSYNMDFDSVDKAGDQVFEDKGIKVVTDLSSYLYLHNTTLEFSGGLEGKGFYFNNPNAARTCGCGESFSL